MFVEPRRQSGVAHYPSPRRPTVNHLSRPRRPSAAVAPTVTHLMPPQQQLFNGLFHFYTATDSPACTCELVTRNVCRRLTAVAFVSLVVTIQNAVTMFARWNALSIAALKLSSSTIYTTAAYVANSLQTFTLTADVDVSIYNCILFVFMQLTDLRLAK